MKTIASVFVLTIAFLSAGAFAQSKDVKPKMSNVTVVFKNQISSTKDQSRIDACAIAQCFEI